MRRLDPSGPVALQPSRATSLTGLCNHRSEEIAALVQISRLAPSRLSLPGQQDWNISIAEDGAGRTAENELSDPRASDCSDNQHIGIA